MWSMHDPGETMKIQAGSGPGLLCLVILLVIAVIAIAGCVDSTHGPQSLATPTGTQQSEKPVVTRTVTMSTTTVPLLQKTSDITPTPQKTSTPLPTTGSSDGVIHLDPLGVIYTGENYVITGTTSLPAGTDLVLQLRPDNGTIPTGYDKDAPGGCAGGPAWITKGNGTVNRIVIEGSITPGEHGQGKWVAVVGDRKDPDWFKNGDYFEMGRHIAYAYFTMK
jgi:hypothetical protein